MRVRGKEGGCREMEKDTKRGGWSEEGKGRGSKKGGEGRSEMEEDG
jgi:hypothetical protein